MSLAGLKKQFNKANQYMSEKLGSVKGSQLDEDFIELERKTDAYNHLVDQLQHKTKEFLQPNPAARTKLNFQTAVLKARGQARGENVKYIQPENILSDVLTKAGTDIGEDSPFATSVMQVGEAFSSMAEIKDSLEMSVKQNFLDPLEQLQNKDLKEIMHHRKKLSGRRLDYDYKKKKGEKVTKEELRIAEEKFEESKELCYSSMMNLMDSDEEHIGELYAFTNALREYYKQCFDVCDVLTSQLSDQMSVAASRPKQERKAISRRSYDDASSDSSSDQVSFSTPISISPPVSRPSANLPTQKPQAKALYDFDKENEGELSFREGDIITLTGQIDENWFEGTVNGESGFFPVNYVDVLVPLT